MMLVALISTSSATRAAPSFSFVTIDVPDALSTAASGINDLGQMGREAGIAGIVGMLVVDIVISL